MSLNVNYSRNIFKFLKKNCLFDKKHLIYAKRFCTSNSDVCDKAKKMEDFFFTQEVQGILKKITGVNFEKIFKPKKQRLEPYTYEFVTEKRLKELQNVAREKADEKLQMPPVISIREPINEILAKDPELQGYLQHKLVFIDTSLNVSSRDRIITVREEDGTLRKAVCDERTRMNQIFFPVEGRSLEIPKLFESPYLDRLLEEESYVFVLDSACAQFEPDDPEYHRVVGTVYEHVKSKKKFDILRSTRHFGPMAFYFAYKKDIDHLLVDMIERQLISDAADTVKLLLILHPEVKCSEAVDAKTDIDIVQDYIQVSTTQHKAHLELAMQTFLEAQSRKEFGNDKAEMSL